MRPFLLTLLVLTAACAPRPRTEVIVVIDAEPMVQRRPEELLVTVTGGVTVLAFRERGRFSYPVPYPIVVALVPMAGEPNRRFHVDASIRSASGAVIVSTSRTSSWIAGRTLRLDMHLDDQCIGSSVCADGLTCINVANVCQPDFVDPNRLPELDPLFRTDVFVVPDAGRDAFADDTRVPDIDAQLEPPDAFVVPDPDANIDATFIELDTPEGPCGELDEPCCPGDACNRPGLVCDLREQFCRDACPIASACTTCLARTGCVYCAGACVAGSAAGPLDPARVCTPLIATGAACFDCDTLTPGGCAVCAAHSSCGWCDGACRNGTMDGSADGLCVPPTWVWNGSFCPPDAGFQDAGP